MLRSSRSSFLEANGLIRTLFGIKTALPRRFVFLMMSYQPPGGSPDSGSPTLIDQSDCSGYDKGMESCEGKPLEAMPPFIVACVKFQLKSEYFTRCALQLQVSCSRAKMNLNNARITLLKCRCDEARLQVEIASLLYQRRKLARIICDTSISRVNQCVENLDKRFKRCVFESRFAYHILKDDQT